MVFAEHVAHDAGALHGLGGRQQPHAVHGKENAPLRGLHAVKDIGQSAALHNGERVLEVGLGGVPGKRELAVVLGRHAVGENRGERLFNARLLLCFWLFIFGSALFRLFAFGQGGLRGGIRLIFSLCLLLRHVVSRLRRRLFGLLLRIRLGDSGKKIQGTRQFVQLLRHSSHATERPPRNRRTGAGKIVGRNLAEYGARLACTEGIRSGHF